MALCGSVGPAGRTGHRHNIVAGLSWMGFRHGAHPSSRTLQAPQIECHLLMQQSLGRIRAVDGVAGHHLLRAVVLQR